MKLHSIILLTQLTTGHHKTLAFKFITPNKHLIIYGFPKITDSYPIERELLVNGLLLLGAHINTLNNYHQSHVLRLIHILTNFN